MSDILFTFNIVFPIVIIILIGFIFKKINLVSAETLHNLDKVCFKVLLPISLFNNIYASQDFSVDWKFITWIVSLLVIIFLLGILVVIIFVKDKKQKGVILQGLFRSNYAIIGIPLALSIAGAEGAELASIISIITIPIYNILAIIALTIFVKEENEKHQVLKIIVKIFKNPLIIGVLLGILSLLIRQIFKVSEINFRLSDIEVVYVTLKTLGSLATPLALLTLGGLFSFSYVKKVVKPLVSTLVLRMIIIPVIVFSLSLIFFGFDKSEYAVMIAIFCSPVAISSAIMAKEMKNDGVLANQIVVWSTITSAVTVSLVIFIFRLINIF